MNEFKSTCYVIVWLFCLIFLMFYWQISILDSRIKFRWARHKMPINLFRIICLSENQNKNQTVPSKSQIITLLRGAFETKSWRMPNHVSLNWFFSIKILFFNKKYLSLNVKSPNCVSKSKIIIVFFFTVLRGASKTKSRRMPKHKTLSH